MLWAAKWSDATQKKIIFTESRIGIKILFRLMLVISMCYFDGGPIFGTILTLHSRMSEQEKAWVVGFYKQKHEYPCILIASKNVGAEGLNLIEGNEVYFFDLS